MQKKLKQQKQEFEKEMKQMNKGLKKKMKKKNTTSQLLGGCSHNLEKSTEVFD